MEQPTEATRFQTAPNCLFQCKKKIKGVVYQINFLSNSENIPRHGPLTFCSVCTLKKQSGVHIQPWLCKRQTNRVARVEPPSQVIKYRHFSCNECCNKLISSIGGMVDQFIK